MLAFTIAVTVLTAVLFGLLPAWQNSQVGARRDLARTVRRDRGRPHARLRPQALRRPAGRTVRGAAARRGALHSVARQSAARGSRPADRDGVTFLARPAVPSDTHARCRRTDAHPGTGGGPGRAALWARAGPRCSPAAERTAPTLRLRADSGRSPFTFFNAVTPGFFEALGIPLQGRRGLRLARLGHRQAAGARERDVDRRPTSTARSPIGPDDRARARGRRPTVEIVGVFGDSRYHDVRGHVPPQTFFNLDSVHGAGPAHQRLRPRRRRPAAGHAHAFREKSHRIDPNIVVTDPAHARRSDRHAACRTSGCCPSCRSAFAVLATILAVVGVHGVLVFQIARRTTRNWRPDGARRRPRPRSSAWSRGEMFAGDSRRPRRRRRDRLRLRPLHPEPAVRGPSRRSAGVRAWPWRRLLAAASWPRCCPRFGPPE